MPVNCPNMRLTRQDAALVSRARSRRNLLASPGRKSGRHDLRSRRISPCILSALPPHSGVTFPAFPIQYRRPPEPNARSSTAGQE